MTPAIIKGSEYPLITIFDGHFFFSIPLFQRPYTWTPEQAEELIDDFLSSLDDEDESNSYFLGSIVLIKEDDLKPEAQVVDGQQRLLTLTILFSVLRYKLRELSNKLRYVFSWDEKDNERLIEYLIKNFSIEWIKPAKIDKIDNKIIKVHTGKNSLLLKLNDEKTEVLLEIDDGRTNKLIAKMEDGKLNIYELSNIDDAIIDDAIGYANDLTNHMYKEKSLIARTPATYLINLRRDESFFRVWIQNEIKSPDGRVISKIKQLTDDLTKTENDAQKNMKDNAKKFFEKLENKSVSELKRLVDFMFNRCFVIVVSTTDSDSAFRIFAILNDRGMNLSHTDILKSELIGEMDKIKQEASSILWESMEDQLGRDAFSDLFVHIRMIKHPEKLRKGILKEFREYVVNPIGDPIKVIQEINKYSKVYHVIRNEEYESSSGAEEINTKLGWLNNIDNKDWLPPAIHYMSLDKNQHELSCFFTDLERLAAGLMICRADVNTRIKRYGQILNAIKSNEDLYKTTSPLQLTPTDCNEIIVNLNKEDFYKSKFALYVLLRLNDAVLEEGVIFNFSRVTIEHVLPQTLPEGGKWGEFSESDHIKYVNKLGNLILLTGPKNKGNHEFKVKKKEYYEDKSGIISFPLSVDAIQNVDEWTKIVIDSRQDELIEKLKEIWKLKTIA